MYNEIVFRTIHEFVKPERIRNNLLASRLYTPIEARTSQGRDEVERIATDNFLDSFESWFCSLIVEFFSYMDVLLSVSPTTKTGGYYLYGRRDSINKTRFLLVRTSHGDGKQAFKRVTLPGGSTVMQLRKMIEKSMRNGVVKSIWTLPDRVGYLVTCCFDKAPSIVQAYSVKPR
ncbi:unnamed protein product [Haemonchus placei]|uniref:Uncharacterized protein n=1 Tax=Haemonchus placei TaxID=6290 RepID=A0A3P7SZ49_HAEPC|nr:unnamed protein product [Haemonchus placei]